MVDFHNYISFLHLEGISRPEKKKSTSNYAKYLMKNAFTFARKESQYPYKRTLRSLCILYIFLFLLTFYYFSNFFYEL